MRNLAAICSGALLIIAVHSNARPGEETSEQRLAKTMHSSQQLPYALVADAGANAAQFSDLAQVRLQYVQNYAKGAQDALVWGSQISRGYAASVKTCETASDAQLRTIECGYSKGIEAIVWVREQNGVRQGPLRRSRRSEVCAGQGRETLVSGAVERVRIS
jgi:hypothetical protein